MSPSPSFDQCVSNFKSANTPKPPAQPPTSATSIVDLDWRIRRAVANRLRRPDCRRCREVVIRQRCILPGHLPSTPTRCGSRDPAAEQKVVDVVSGCSEFCWSRHHNSGTNARSVVSGTPSEMPSAAAHYTFRPSHVVLCQLCLTTHLPLNPASALRQKFLCAVLLSNTMQNVLLKPV